MFQFIIAAIKAIIIYISSLKHNLVKSKQLCWDFSKKYNYRGMEYAPSILIYKLQFFSFCSIFLRVFLLFFIITIIFFFFYLFYFYVLLF